MLEDWRVKGKSPIVQDIINNMIALKEVHGKFGLNGLRLYNKSYTFAQFILPILVLILSTIDCHFLFM